MTQQEYYEEIRALCKKVNTKSKKFADENKGKYYGDLGYVIELLSTANNFLK